MKGVLALALVGCCVLTACGEEDPHVSGGASAQLEATIAQIRAAAAGDDRDSALAALDRLRSEAADLRARGEVDAAAHDRIVLAAARVAAELEAVPRTTTTTSTTTTTTTRPVASTTTTRPDQDRDGGVPGKGNRKDDD